MTSQTREIQHTLIATVLEPARALRERIDWELVRFGSTDSPFGRGFFALMEELGIIERERSAAA